MSIPMDGKLEGVKEIRGTVGGLRLPLNKAEKNELYTVVKVSGKDETKKHLSNLGFVEGTQVRVISELNGSIIVDVKGTKLAIGEDLSKRVMVTT